MFHSKILIATHNPAKLSEIQRGLEPLIDQGCKLLSLKEINITETTLETGKTFRENAELKAKYYGKISKLPTLADDGGITIDALNGEPGVKSRRWLGYEASDKELINFTLDRMEKFKNSDRKATLEMCLCFYNPKNESVIFETEKIDGKIAQKPSGNKTSGYPFRALFIVDKYKKYYDELTENEHEEINHRLKAVKKMAKKINNKFFETNGN